MRERGRQRDTRGRKQDRREEEKVAEESDGREKELRGRRREAGRIDIKEQGEGGSERKERVET